VGINKPNYVYWGDRLSPKGRFLFLRLISSPYLPKKRNHSNHQQVVELSRQILPEYPLSSAEEKSSFEAENRRFITRSSLEVTQKWYDDADALVFLHNFAKKPRGYC